MLIRGMRLIEDFITEQVIIADLNRCALHGVHLRPCIVLHGYRSLGKTSRIATKAAHNEALL